MLTSICVVIALTILIDKLLIWISTKEIFVASHQQNLTILISQST